MTKTLQTDKNWRGFHKSHFQKYRSRRSGGHHSGSCNRQKGWKPLGNKNYPKHQQSKKRLCLDSHMHNLTPCIVNNSLNAVTSTQVKSQAHYVQALINTMNLSIKCPKLAGHVAHFIQNWEVLTEDHWVIQTVAGYQLDLTSTPHQLRVPPEVKTSEEKAALVTLEVTELLEKGAIVETNLSADSFVSQIFLVEKDLGYIPVINLKGLNQFIRTDISKWRPAHSSRASTSRGLDGKMNLKDAYLQMPIHPTYQPLLTFQWRDKYYKFTCLPFGLSAAPRVFTKVLKPVVGFLRQVGC